MTTGQAIAIGFAMFGASALMALIVLMSVALGAFIVYKTKREDGEAFTFQAKGGDAFVAPGEIDDDNEGLPLGAETQERMYQDILQKVANRTDVFMKQTGGGVGDAKK